MLTSDYRDLFIAIATAAASLTGLLFVVVTVAERPKADSLPAVVQEVRAAAALLSFTNALAVTLFSLVPGAHVGYPAIAVAVIGLLFSLAAIRSYLAHPLLRTRRARHVVLTLFLLVVFALQLVFGVQLVQRPHNTNPLDGLSDILIVSLLIGIARAWGLVGGRDTGIISSLAVIVGRNATLDVPGDGPVEGDRPASGA